MSLSLFIKESNKIKPEKNRKLFDEEKLHQAPLCFQEGKLKLPSRRNTQTVTKQVDHRCSYVDMRPLNALTDGASAALCVSSFQEATILLVKKWWRSSHPLTICLTSRRLCPRRLYVAWLAGCNCGTKKSTCSIKCEILNCSIKSPLTRRSCKVVRPSLRSRSL